MPADLVHLELHTPDLPAAADFYRVVLGWRPRHVAPSVLPYMSVDIGISAGLVGCGTATPVWIPYIEVSDVASATAAAVACGAEQTLAPRTGPQGRRSVVTSAVAGDLAFWEPT